MEQKINLFNLENIIPSLRLGMYKRYIKKVGDLFNLKSFTKSVEFSKGYKVLCSSSIWGWKVVLVFYKGNRTYKLVNSIDDSLETKALSDLELWVLMREIFNLRGEESPYKLEPVEFRAVRKFFKKGKEIWFSYFQLVEDLNRNQDLDQEFVDSRRRAIIQNLSDLYDLAFQKGYQKGLNKSELEDDIHKMAELYNKASKE